MCGRCSAAAARWGRKEDGEKEVKPAKRNENKKRKREGNERSNICGKRFDAALAEKLS